MNPIVLLPLLFCQTPNAISQFESLQATSVQPIPASRIRSMYVGRSESQLRMGTSQPLISEDGKRLYVGVNSVELTTGKSQVRELFQSASVPGLPIVGSWQRESEDRTDWRRDEDVVTLVVPLSEPSPTSLVIAHTAEEKYYPPKPISRHSFGISQLDLASSSACDNRALLRMMAGTNYPYFTPRIWRDLGSSRTLVGSSEAGKFFFFDEGKIEPVREIPGEGTDRDILLVATKQGILVKGSNAGTQRSVSVSVESFFPGRGFPYLEQVLHTDIEASYYQLQATALPGSRILVTMSPWEERERAASKAYILDFLTGEARVAGHYAILATSRSGKWVLLGSISWSEPAYLLRF